MEAVVALARQPGTTVTVSYRGAGFTPGRARNIEEVRRLAASGRVRDRLREPGASAIDERVGVLRTEEGAGDVEKVRGGRGPGAARGRAVARAARRGGRAPRGRVDPARPASVQRRMRVRTFALWAALGARVLGRRGRARSRPPPPAATLPGRAGGRPRPTPQRATSHFVDGKTLLLDGRLGHASIARDPVGGKAETFVLATVTGAGRRGRGALRTPPPVHLAIVVDRSGSMAGAKMSNAVAAAVGRGRADARRRPGDARLVRRRCARVLVPPTVLGASTRPSVEASIRAMRAGGDTCISCALTMATAELDASPGPRDEVKRILLISDGEATTGVRDVRGLRALAARRGTGASACRRSASTWRSTRR